VKQPTHEPVPLSGLTTVTVRTPVVLPDEMVMFAVSLPELTKVVEFTVTPAPAGRKSIHPAFSAQA